MNDKCGCCEGIEPLTPRLISNRPGLNAPAYRIGTHASFLETMRARLSSYFLDIPQEGQDEHGQPDTERVYPLRNLTTRAADDPSIALLDAWATVGDVLTFYQERIANEGYLRTATERRSILELARLTGYALRPGVASTAYLAYTIDNNFKDEVIILAGARAQSAPGPGERPQTFETSEPLNARASWNTLKPRMTMPQTTDSIYNFLFSTGLNQQLEDALNSGQLTPVLRSAFEKQGIFLYPTGILVLKVQDGVWQIVDPGQDQSYVVIKVDSTSLNIYGPNDCVYLRGIATNLKPNDPLLVVVDGGPLLFRIKEVKLDAAADRTLIIFQSTAGLPPSTGLSSMAEGLRDRALEVVASEAPSEKTTGDVPKQVGKDVLFNVIQGLSKPPSVPPANTFQLIRNIAKSFSRNSDSGLQVVGAIRPDFKRILPLALSNVQVTPTNPLEVFALRLKTGVYGNTAPLEPIKDRGIVIGTREWPLDGIQTVGIMLGITVLNGGGMSGNATISVTNANADFRQTITLSSAAPTTVSLGGVNFTFSKMAGYPYTLNYQSNSGTTSLTYQPGHGTFSVTMNVNSQPPRTINIAFNQTTSITLQSHNLKIGYFMADDEAVVSVTDETLLPPEPKNQIALDGTYDQIVPGSWYVITRPNAPQQLAQVIGQIRDAQTVAKTDYNFPAKVTQLTLDQDWLTADDKLLSGIRSTTVFAQSEKLELAEEPIDPIKDAICGGADNAIELDGLYSDLKSGRWLIVTGERTDIRSPDPNDPGNPNKTVVVSGVRASELVMLSEVKHDVSMIGI
ncbi:MAG TPA: hypothetical protein VK249_06710, partial [Anaerolineales bacterium]|nr:hypothetical protein [Anaerolineales bacterium]